MSRLEYFQNLIQEKRKKTPFREFVKEIASWNTLNIYKRDGKITRYPDSGRVKKLGDIWDCAPYEHEEWNGVNNNFFEYFQRLLDKIPLQYLLDFGNNENCDYADSVFGGAKNAYLTFVTGYSAENIAYSAYSYTNIHNVFNSFFCSNKNSNIFMSASVTESHNIFYSKFIVNSSNIWFSTNLIGCEECILSDGLENKKYHIKNREYSKEEYQSMKAELMKQKNLFPSLYDSIRTQKARNIGSEDVTGENIIKSHGTKDSFWINKIHNSNNVVVGNGGDNCDSFYDAVDVGLDSDNFYATSSAGYKAHHIYCSSQIGESSNLYYCYFIENCHHCLGCIGLKNKSYCILNKQYTKEEWEVKVFEIFASMERDGTLGEFFPASMNPFYFNDTLAYLIDDTFTKEEVEKAGYLWRDEPIRVDIPEGREIIKTTDLTNFEKFDPAGNWYIDPSILEKVIIDEDGNYFRIIKMEYDFLMKHGLPLPRTHWMDRMKTGFCF